MPNLGRVAAILHKHLCTHSWHGYTQGAGRWGDGEGVCRINIDGRSYTVNQGDRDCSSSVIECWRAAIAGTPYAGKLDAATYTGNMREVFVKSGLFTWHPMGDGYIAQPGDIYLNEVNHTAMCQTAIPDVLSEFLIDENGQIIGGAVGDQTGRESVVREYYDFPWDGILAYNGKADDAVAGWIKDAKGWWYRYANGSYPKNTWLELDAWYWFDADGYAACFSWREINGKSYFFDANCRMLYSCVVHWGDEDYVLGADGAMLEGSVPLNPNGSIRY